MPPGVAYPLIMKSTDQPARLQRFPHVRVAQIVMDYLAFGWSAEEMCRQHSYLRIAEAHAAMLYYWDHQGEIDQEIHAEWEQAERDRVQASSSPFLLRMRSIEAL